MILEEGFANQHQSAACNMVEIGCILSKDCNLSSVVCTCNSRHVLRGPGVKQADYGCMNEPSITLRPHHDEEECSLLPAIYHELH